MYKGYSAKKAAALIAIREKPTAFQRMVRRVTNNEWYFGIDLSQISNKDNKNDKSNRKLSG